jgi:hypothetical protein
MINKELRENAKKLGFYSGLSLGDRCDKDNEIFLSLLNNYMRWYCGESVSTYYDDDFCMGWYWCIEELNGLIREQSNHYQPSDTKALGKGLIKLVNNYIEKL